eukprot:5558035-Pleurochrysis_carterae.AAC.1
MNSVSRKEGQRDPRCTTCHASIPPTENVQNFLHPGFDGQQVLFPIGQYACETCNHNPQRLLLTSFMGHTISALTLLARAASSSV